MSCSAGHEWPHPAPLLCRAGSHHAMVNLLPKLRKMLHCLALHFSCSGFPPLTSLWKRVHRLTSSCALKLFLKEPSNVTIVAGTGTTAYDEGCRADNGDCDGDMRMMAASDALVFALH